MLRVFKQHEFTAGRRAARRTREDPGERRRRSGREDEAGARRADEPDKLAHGPLGAMSQQTRCATSGWRGDAALPSNPWPPAAPVCRSRTSFGAPTDDLQHVVCVAQGDGAALPVRSGLPAREHFRRERPPRDGCDTGTPIAPQGYGFSGGRSRHYGRRNTGPPAPVDVHDWRSEHRAFRLRGRAGRI